MRFYTKKYNMMRNLRLAATDFLTIGMALLFLAFSVSATAAPPKSVRNNEEGGGLGVVISKANVTISKKSLQWVYTLGGKFKVSPETLIIGPDGKEVGLKEMLVPCDVQVSYAVEKGRRVAFRIDIKRIADGAAWQWTSETPE